jgi:hypothetical protein
VPIAVLNSIDMSLVIPDSWRYFGIPERTLPRGTDRPPTSTLGLALRRSGLHCGCTEPRYQLSPVSILPLAVGANLFSITLVKIASSAARHALCLGKFRKRRLNRKKQKDYSSNGNEF